MEQIPGRLSRHLPFVYSFLEILLRFKIFLSGKIEEKEADIYRSFIFLEQKKFALINFEEVKADIYRSFLTNEKLIKNRE